MGIMWIMIIALPVILIGWFLYDKRKMESNIKKRGGMSIVYSELIELIMNSNAYCKILEEGQSYIYIGNGIFHYEILATFSSVNITFRRNDLLFGESELKWDFGAVEPQDFMFFKIEKDIESYFNKKTSHLISD